MSLKHKQTLVSLVRFAAVLLVALALIAAAGGLTFRPGDLDSVAAYQAAAWAVWLGLGAFLALCSLEGRPAFAPSWPLLLAAAVLLALFLLDHFTGFVAETLTCLHIRNDMTQRIYQLLLGFLPVKGLVGTKRGPT